MANNLENKKGKALIFLVEDDRFLRELLIRKLETEGFNTSVSVDGEEALKKIKDESPQLVLLDLVLPGIDGFEVLKRIKQDVQLSKIPVVILSNLGQKEEVEKGISLGAEDYLIKAHFTPDEVVKKVKELLGKNNP